MLQGMATPQNRVRLVGTGGAEVRAAAALLITGAGLVALSLALPHPRGGDPAAQLTIAAAMAFAGVLCSLLRRRVPTVAVHAILAVTVALAGVLIYASGIAAGQYGTIFVWSTLIASYFFPRRVAVAHLAWLLLVYGVVLLSVPSTVGYSPLTRWIFSLVSLVVVMLLTTEIVARRARADERARRFFDLSRDMLCTANMDGYFVELNDAWTQQLGYSAEELRALPFIERVHLDDRERTEAEAAALFVLLPGASAEAAAEVVERLRERTPREQTCSAGLACWDFSEGVDELLARADRALYLAKAGGRDQLAQVATTASIAAGR
jgi:PAS domain-containing protein